MVPRVLALRTLLLGLALLGLALPAMATAQDPAVRVPDDAPVVAGPTASGATLVAFGRGTEVCLAIVTPGDDESRQIRCDAPPRRATDSSEVYGAGDDDDELAAHGGVVPAEVARVEVRFAVPGHDRVRRDSGVAAETVAGDAYRGPGAGRLRFYLVDGRPDSPWLHRYLDAAGTTIGASEIPFDTPVRGRPLTLARGSGGGRLRAVRRLRLAATPLDRGRLIEETCFEIPGRSSSGGVCTSPDRPLTQAMSTAPNTACDRISLPVVTTARVRRVEARLGDGRLARVPLVDVPARFARGLRAGALVVSGPVAVRSLSGFDAAGRRVALKRLALAPPQPCGPSGESSSSFFVYTVDDPGPWKGPLEVRARDDGARLCFTLGELRRDGFDCAVPPLEPSSAYVLLRREGGRALAAAVLPPEVATVELEVDGVKRRVATTGDVPGYGGQYRDAVRFLNVELPRTARLGTFRLLDAQGQPLDRGRPIEAPEIVAGATRSVRVAGVLLRLTEVRYSDPDLPRYVCALLPGETFEDDCGVAFDDALTVVASCAPRRLVVFGLAPRGTRRVTAVTGGGRLDARLVRVGDQTVWVAVLSPRAALRRVVTSGRATRVADIRLPAAARQCGYNDLESLELPGD